MLSVIVPVYNESASVTQTLKGLLDELSRRDMATEVIVVDDGSTDGSAELAAKVEGARLIRHAFNRGYGAAIKTGAREAKGDIVVTFDADGQHNPADVWKAADAVRDGVFVIGDRGHRHRSPLWRSPGKWVLARLVNFLARQPVPDFNSGLRAVHRKEIAAVLDLCADRYSFSASSTLALHGRDLRIASVPIDVHPRIGASSMRMSAGMETIVAILRVSMMFDPLRIFLPAAIVTGLGALGWLTYEIAVRRNVSDTCVVLILASLQLFLLGLVADQVAAVRKTSR